MYSRLRKRYQAFRASGRDFTARTLTPPLALAVRLLAALPGDSSGATVLFRRRRLRGLKLLGCRGQGCGRRVRPGERGGVPAQARKQMGKQGNERREETEGDAEKKGTVCVV